MTQNEWIVHLMLLYWAAGDIKDLYDHEQLDDFKEKFNLKTDDDVEAWLEKNAGKIEGGEDYLIYTGPPMETI